MSSHQPVPAAFAHLTDLSSDLTGTFVLYATDDYFAEKENLLKPHAPEWREGAYTDKGKWMDGWESQRKRGEGHDFAILRLGSPGSIEGVFCDTTHFKGNAPQEVSLEIAELSDTASDFSQVEWREVLPRTAVKPDFPNELVLSAPSARATHVRFHIYPDGGVGRLRLYGRVHATPRTFWQPGSIDLAAIGNGGSVAAVSDQFFGPPSNLLLPGRGVNMGDGWETKRRRTPGSDWCVIKLARRAVVERVELDTHFFKGNAPQATLIEALDEEAIGSAEVERRLRAPDGWQTFLERTPLVQHRCHQLEPARRQPVTHLRVHIFPHGGVNRMRVIGHALDTPSERAALGELATMDAAKARELFQSFCGQKAFSEKLAAARPFASVRAFFAAIDELFWQSSEAELCEAFAAHPRIGEQKAAASQTAQSAAWSRGEQAQVPGSDAEVLARLAELNQRYFEKFGFIFIVCATGKSAREMLLIAESRVDNPRHTEIDNAAREQLRITRLRAEKWLLSTLG